MQEYLNSVVPTSQNLPRQKNTPPNWTSLRQDCGVLRPRGTCFSSVVSACAADNERWELGNWPQKCYTPGRHTIGKLDTSSRTLRMVSELGRSF